MSTLDEDYGLSEDYIVIRFRERELVALYEWMKAGSHKDLTAELLSAYVRLEDGVKRLAIIGRLEKWRERQPGDADVIVGIIKAIMAKGDDDDET